MSTYLPVPSAERSLAVLVGNGLSIAYDPNLRLDRINALIQRRITESIDTDGTAARTLVDVARGIHSGDPAEDFESLIGALEQYAVSLRTLQPLVDLAGPHNQVMSNALELSSQFVELLHSEGLSHVLEVIAEASTAHRGSMSVIQSFTDDLIDTRSAARITIGNLNYDSLAMATLAGAYRGQFCDMSDPRLEEHFDVVEGGWKMLGRPLRRTGNYPSRRVRLVHLHGSLAWLRRRSDGLLVRFEIGELRHIGYWQHLRRGTTDWEPQVVLTNQQFKSQAVLQAPYALAYETFRSGLAAADRWVIAGYSFRDACVNEVLKAEFQARKRAGLPTSVAVVTYGDELTDWGIAGHFGEDPWDELAWLSLFRGGIAGLADDPAWVVWRGVNPLANAS